MAENFYWYEGRKIELIPATTKRAFRLSVNQNIAGEMEKANASHSSISNVSHLGGGIIVLDAAPTITAEAVLNTASISGRPLDVFEMGGDTHAIVTREFVCKFKGGTSQDQIDELNRANAVSVVSRQSWDPTSYVLAVPPGQESTTIEVANRYHENAIVEFAQPNFVRVMPPSYIPNDPLLANQWPIQNTGQGGGVHGQDIHAVAAWDITLGSNAITIAIIDEGVDYSHEDFNSTGKLVTGYDAIRRIDDPTPNATDGHGTCCAGIATAAGDNGIGICGVAPGCRLMGVRIAYNVNGRWVTTDAQIADGIGIAFTRGADVLSNSWGGGSPSAAITSAIRAAKTSGRGGKGCFVCFAAGNYNTAVSYPGNLPEVFAVAACNEYGERKSPTSRDGETWWGSNFGPEVAVTAPGVHIETTDIMGGGGYNTLGNYFATFNGTSAATPHVAGVAALVLSVNPNLTADQVANLLKATADSIIPPSPNIYTGAGRVNAEQAVRKASTWLTPVAAAAQPTT